MSRGQRRANVPPHGQIRQSQIVTTFGPGAMVDLPEHAVIISGLDEWTGYQDHPVIEDRLAAKVQTLLELDSVRFYAPPAESDDPNAPATGITAWLFPEWFVAHFDDPNKETGVRSRPLVHRRDLEKGMKYRRDRREKAVKVVPVRFVQACPRGHVSDIDWRVFAHAGITDCTRVLWLDERGATGDLTDVIVRCECGASRQLSLATKMGDAPLGFCNGPRPWLGAYSQERCGRGDQTPQINRLLVRAASNSYFSQSLSVISIPEPGAEIRQAVDLVWEDFLQFCESKSDVKRERKKPKVSAAIEQFSDADVWSEIERRKSPGVGTTKGIREAELETLLQSQEQLGEDQPDGVFCARAIAIPSGEPKLTAPIARLVQVHRLREVVAQIGFTRFEAAMADVNGELALDVERAALSLNQKWFPAIENRGEGVFVAIKPIVVDSWLKRSGVEARGAQLLAGFQAWQQKHSAAKAVFPGLPYIMLHTLSHLLITAVSLDCGYAASSIRERIYVGESGFGILLYTASSDAEGTLGGLVASATSIDRYLRQAVELGKLCSNDPVCAQHQADQREEERFLLGAACHGCVLLAESSCERRNDFLDRALVVPTVDNEKAAFFDDIDI